MSKNKEKNSVKEKKNIATKQGMFFELLKTIIIAILIVVPLKMFILQPFFVSGSSMEPNFHDKDYLLVWELGYKKTVLAAGDTKFLTVKPFGEIKRGEVIVFRNPVNPSQFFIKRVIGLPGEKVVINQGRVIIYNQEHPHGLVLDEKEYLPQGVQTEHSRVFETKAGQYVVLGDNRGNSSDSRYWGVLDQDLIIGKVILRAWPFRDFKIFTH